MEINGLFWIFLECVWRKDGKFGKCDIIKYRFIYFKW